MKKLFLSAVFVLSLLVAVNHIYASRVWTASNQALSVSGSSASVTGTTMTVSAWVNYSSITAGHQVVAKWNTGSPYLLQFSLSSSPTSGKGSFGVGNGSTSFSATTACTSSVSINTWYNIVATMSGSTLNVYQNGVSCVSGSTGVTIGNNSLPLCIGDDQHVNNSSDCTTGDGPMLGQIAEVAIWNVALTQNEITSLASCIPPPLVHGGPNLVAYWPIWGIDSPEGDYGGKQASATVLNAPAQANHVCGPLQGIQ